MIEINTENNFDGIIDKLSNGSEFDVVHHRSLRQIPLPSAEGLNSAMECLKQIIFPGFYGKTHIKKENIRYHIGSLLHQAFGILSKQINRGLCFDCTDLSKSCGDCEDQARKITAGFITKLPEIKRMLAEDVIAAYNGDPAAKSFGEAIFCYPSIQALTHHRVAHEILKYDVPLIPRIISEMAHADTGIDIHPGAQIGERFFIDHGTGVVIGETAVIGNNVQLYQGVTLGAKSFPLDENGKPIKGIPRHPIVEDDVIIYSNSTVLGRITIGKGAVVGGNMWITKDVPAGAKIIQNSGLK